ncbi:putative multidrug resistance protein fnx1 [Lindgomyces ingoldianus]|uniref:Multidrug resistance protein fnx1 n=1 Tax=Lindgomyces ingoldianus TaxID=673940 RepID=A0ACB6QXW1_9PLEO|nr:putative multidrug resistance protein fnx1 [Lindgomyces ingoldianus]KAF2471879.1 putative multidrug resistance protein fnx1 [Lindgomyces ingoldianus]
MTAEAQEVAATSSQPLPNQEKPATLRNEIVCSVEQGDSEEAPNYLSGIKLHLLTVALCLSIFLVNFEISVVSTSLVAITDGLKAFGRSSWIVTGYLIAYTTFMVVLAKLSDSFGRKTVLVTSLALFTIFSGACGAAQTMNQLIVFRAFQGLGASGVFWYYGSTLVLVVLFEMLPPEKYPVYSVLVTALFAISMFAGPLVGGVINTNTTYRWVFLLNVPVGAFALVLLLVCIPTNFPYHGQHSRKRSSHIRNVDMIGASLMLITLTLLITGFEEASDFSPWVSAEVLVPILLSIPFLVMFLFYERWVTLKGDDRPEPIFPWRFCKSRVIMGIYVNAFLVGAIFVTCIIEIPLRFQVVNHESPWKAGVRLVPFSIPVPVGAGLVAALCGKRRLPPIYLLFVGSTLQLLGLVFMSRMTLDEIQWQGQYGLQTIAGLGCGLTIGVSTLLMPFVIEKRDLATSTSAVVQFRLLGGALAVAIVTAVMNNDVRRTLLPLMSPGELAQILRTTEAIEELKEPLRTIVKDAFLKGYNMQLRILFGFAAVEIPATIFMWQKVPVKIA